MSYARWGAESDVYVFGTGDRLICCECTLDVVDGSFICDTPLEMIAHLVTHVVAGHRVPYSAVGRLADEAAHPEQYADES
jgi:hypothetical protein